MVKDCLDFELAVSPPNSTSRHPSYRRLREKPGGLQSDWSNGTPLWLIAVGVGGLTGSIIGTRYQPDYVLRPILAVVLFAPGAKLLLS